MTSTAAIIAEFIILAGVGDNVDDENHLDLWPVYVGFLGEDVDNAICCYDTAGKLDGRIQRTGEHIEHPGVQVRVRSMDYLAAWNKVTEIARVLAGLSGEEVDMGSSGVYLLNNVSQTGSIVPMGVEGDDRNRFNFTLNATTTIEERN